MNKGCIIRHYDMLIEEGNNPVRDSKALKEYMDKWEGRDFIDQMELNKSKSLLEIGVGMGQLAVKVVSLCAEFVGIDVSAKTIERAQENLSCFDNIILICGDFVSHDFKQTFDVIYSLLNLMHIREKQTALNKVYALLNNTGRLILSIDKNQDEFIDIGINKISIYPDNPERVKKYINAIELSLVN